MMQLLVVGNIGKDAAVTSSNGDETFRFTVAVNGKRRNPQGEQIEETTWFTVFTRQKSLVPYLLKGTQVLVQGNAKFSMWTNSEGYINMDLTIAASQIQLLGSKKEETTAAQTTAAPAAPAAPVPQSARSQAAPAPVSRPAQGGRLRTTPDVALQATPDDDLPF